MKAIVANDFMVSRLFTLSPDMDVFDAVRLLLKNRISGAPVVDPQGRFLGVFSERCSLHVLLDAAYESLPTTQVGPFMDTDARTIGPETDLLSIAQVFLLTSARRLPVVDQQGILRGQVSRRDVLTAAMKQLSPPTVRESSFLYLSALHERDHAPSS
jgi:CBS domain-containing protein